ncbi:unnamed protein product [Effrenium voratum]|uniref:Amidohydrolase-related domain-containing protein n=1 Tax=Effrenium voratum TaxID=2562239 RepID=A0AA36IDC8_9DINO|nr:unnamed protein product [Effrenium voratum]
MAAGFAFFGTCVDTPRLGEVRGLEAPSLLVVSDGRISQRCMGAEALERRRQLEQEGVEVRVLEQGEVLLPGFIDGHIHFPQFCFAGCGIDMPLMHPEGFLAKYAFPTEESMGEVERAKVVYRAALEVLLHCGTTTAVIYGSLHLGASKVLVDVALERKGPRAFVGKVCADRYCPDTYVEETEQSLQDTEDFIQYTQSRRTGSEAPFLVQPVVTPRFLPTCTPKLLQGLGRLADKYGCIIQSHLSESIDEVEFSATLFPGQTDAEVFHQFGLLKSPSMMGHSVQLMQGEEELLRQNGAAIAHCPLSNFFFASGALPVKQLLKRGVKVALGTDIAGGYSPSMLTAMRSAVMAAKTLQFRHVKGCAFGTESEAPSAKRAKNAEAPAGSSEDELSHFEALYLATKGGAEALDLGHLLGSFEVGCRFDALRLRSQVGPMASFPASSQADMLLKIITLGDDRNVKQVFVDGELVHSL